MAKIPSGILGPPRGKIGSVVGASWKGIAYIRAYVIPANPKTAAQVATRALFADLVVLAQQVLGAVLQPFWDPFVVRNSGFAHFIGVNRPLYTSQEVYTAVKMAQGTLEGQIIDGALYSASNVDVSWTSAPQGNGAGTDKMIAVVFDEVNKVAFVNTSAIRSAEGVTVAVGAGRTAANLNVWLFCTDSLTAPTQVSVSDHAQSS